MQMPRTASSNASDVPSKTQLTPDDWIRAAAEVLVDKSVDAVRVEVLSKNLGVTRGGFYWHFKDRDDLLRQLLVWWRDTATEQIIDHFETRSIKPRELLRDLLLLPFHGEATKVAATTGIVRLYSIALHQKICAVSRSPREGAQRENVVRDHYNNGTQRHE